MCLHDLTSVFRIACTVVLYAQVFDHCLSLSIQVCVNPREGCFFIVRSSHVRLPPTSLKSKNRERDREEISYTTHRKNREIRVCVVFYNAAGEYTILSLSQLG
jgi:hypothetical protein